VDEKMKAKIKERDNGWKEVMDLAKKYGFIVSAYGGTAQLATNKNQYESWGEEVFLMHQHDLFGGFDRPE
jgi:hypothetical protein